MKKVLLGMALMLGTLSAAPLCGGAATSVQSGVAAVQETVASMKAYGTTGCLSADKIFANFSNILIPGGIQAIPAAWQVNISEPFTDIHVIDFVQDNAGNPLKNTTPGVNNKWGIQYTIAVDIANYPFKYITNVGVSQNAISGNGGSATIQKYVYDSTGSILWAGPPQLQTSGSAVYAQIAPQQQLLIKEFITLNNATATAFTDRFDQTTIPEPATYGMIGLGLAALGLISRRKKA